LEEDIGDRKDEAERHKESHGLDVCAGHGERETSRVHC
jgi:hypothetical protein